MLPAKRSGESDGCSHSLACQHNFPGSANIVIYESQRELRDRLHSNSAETRDLIYQLLINQGELRQIHEMQNAGVHIAESIMEAGQLVRPFIARRNGLLII